MLRDRVPFNRAGKVSHHKDTFAQKDAHMRTLAGELEKGRVVRKTERGFTKNTKASHNVGSNVFPTKPHDCERCD